MDGIRVGSRLTLALRVLVGLVFVLFGANYFVEFLPKPEGTAATRGFGRALAETGYMWPLIKGTEIAAGMLLLTGIWVPLGLVVLAPLVVNIALWNVLLDPSGVGIAIGVTLPYLALVWAYRDAYRGMFRVG